MKKTIILKGNEQKKLVATILSNLPDKPLHEVIIQEHKKNRSISQNSLYWQWLTILSNELGYTKDELHFIYKRKYLTRIFMRDDENYASMVESLTFILNQGFESNAENIRDQIIRLTSTTDCNTAQMSEYMTDIERAAMDIGIQLPRPDDNF